jgi:long-chain acyl-CoA synthetase
MLEKPYSTITMNQPTRLFDFPLYQLTKAPLKEMMTSQFNGQWRSISTEAFVDKMHLVSRSLIGMGIKPGDKIAIITHANRMEWDILDQGILQIGAIDVPIYPTMTEQDYEYIMNHSEAKLCFVSNAELYLKMKNVFPKVPLLQGLYTFDEVTNAENWEGIFKHAASVSNDDVKKLSDTVKETDMATIIYTSGTTGLPKGVMLSHRNIASNALASEERLPDLTVGNRCLSFLPICHIYERMLHYLYMYKSVHMYLGGMEAIKDDLLVARPHMFTGVPRLFEKFYDGIYAKGMANKGIKKILFKWAHDLAMEWKPDGENGSWYEMQLTIARKLVFSKVKTALGLTEIQAIASGSAALQPRLAKFFNGMGFGLKEGYGLTETSPVISVNTLRKPHMWREKSVGKMLPGVEVKIAEDGEILCKGPNVMLGYYKDHEKTEEVLKDGWFHTGDIGKVEDGFLFITDRKKELFKTSGGKYVAPQVIENALKESIYIEQVMVIGDGEKFAAALIVPELVLLKQWAEKQGIPTNDVIQMLNNPKTQGLFEKEINRINPSFGKWEQIKAFRLLPRPLSIDQGEITPTLKLKRKKIMENWSDLAQDIFK